jgi:methionyl-tRNA synthetase
VVEMLNSDRDDLSVSRPKQRINWGIEVPNNSDQTIYVWLDALTNYLTVMNYADHESFDLENVNNFVHFVGKDIAKFHCIYWPAFLASAFGSESMPRKVFNHCHWLRDRLKMSKSIGNVVEPLPLIDQYGIDSVRLYFLSQGPILKDMDFCYEKLTSVHNEFLIDAYLNLLQRVTGKKMMKKLDHTLNRPASLPSDVYS